MNKRIDNLADADYRAIKAVSKSALDWFAKSPAHYKHVVIDGNRPDPTPAMATGSAFDTLLLTPQIFETTYAVAPDVRRGTKAWDEFEAANQGKILIKNEELARIKAMVDSVRSHQAASELLASGTAQVSYTWKDTFSGLDCKGRADFVTTKGAIVDVKTTQCASPSEFSKSMASFRYHVQAAMYLNAQTCSGGPTTSEFYFIAVEKEPPYLTAVYLIDQEALALGFATMQAELGHLAQCLKRNDWPGYHAGIETLNLPPWVYKS